MLRALLGTMHRRILFALLALLLGMAGSVAVSNTLAAQSGPSQSCSGDYVIQTGSSLFGGTGNRLYSNTNLPGWVTSRTYGLPQTIPAGTYEVSAVAYDGYVGRETVFQANEVWFAEFIGGGGVLATTGTTGDVPDGVTEAFWSGGLGTITLAADATQLTARHGFLTNGVPNSVEPVCLGLTDVTPPPPTTTTLTPTTTTTTIVSTSTEAPPPTTDPPAPPPTDPPAPPPTDPPPTSPPAPPTSVGPTGTDEPETQVLGAVEEAGVATAVGGEPDFTG
ncbi:MAG: hypothetical protein ACR2QE_19845 [Acidimicrobiales bacterium]